MRFRKWQYALGAIMALAHDVMMMVSFYSIFDGVLPFTMEVDQAFIAAVLTIIGFSINDTVVVFDRVREYLAHHKLATDKKAGNQQCP
jgi:SecD/SecF fusion protein